jgi:hypothetical protein
METTSIARVLCLLGAIFLALAGLYCLLWLASSSSLACTACNCTYSLLAENARCRQPPLAGLLAAVSFVGCVALGLARRRLRK